jgi:cytochrome c oxidase subunit 2
VYGAEDVVVGHEVVEAEFLRRQRDLARRLRTSPKLDLRVDDTNFHADKSKVRAMKRFLTTVAVVAFAGVLVSGCGDNKNKGAAATTTTAAAAAGKTITLVATNFQFDQTTLTAEAGKPLTLVIKNEGTVDHNLTVEKLNVNKDAGKGESAEQTVTPAAGTYDYHCEYHPTQMKGTLTVS